VWTLAKFGTDSDRDTGMICIRKLVAIELTFLGPKFILAECGLAVVAGAGWACSACASD